MNFKYIIPYQGYKLLVFISVLQAAAPVSANVAAEA